MAFEQPILIVELLEQTIIDELHVVASQVLVQWKLKELIVLTILRHTY